MPEGDTIFRSAERLRPVMERAQVVSARDNGRCVRADDLLNATFRAVEARGKHLLMHLDDDRVLHSHMGMTGSWHLYQPGEPWSKSVRWAALSMRVQSEDVANAENVSPIDVVCFSPKTLELLTATQFRRHPFLHKLGPDLMHADVDFTAVLARFRIHDMTSIGEAVMNQTLVCGIGNVYKSETLFLTRTDPFVQVGELPDDTILQIVRTASELMRKNAVGHRRQTRLSADGQRLWVYRRRGEPCFKCGTAIEMRRQGDLGRSTYWCPTCQKRP